MLSVFSENIGSIAILAILLTVLALVAFKLIRDKKRGKSSCGASCSNCPMSGKCHPPKKEN